MLTLNISKLSPTEHVLLTLICPTNEMSLEETLFAFGYIHALFSKFDLRNLVQLNDIIMFNFWPFFDMRMQIIFCESIPTKW